MTDPSLSHGIEAPERLPDKTRVGAVHLQVSDLHRALDYYQRVLGMAVLERESTGVSLGVTGERALVRLTAKAGATRRTLRAVSLRAASAGPGGIGALRRTSIPSGTQARHGQPRRERSVVP